MTASPPTLDPTTAYALWAASYPPHAHNPLMQAEERAMLALLPTDLAGLSVLDAGCGSGRYLHHVRERGAREVVGVDLSREMLKRAITDEGRRTKDEGQTFVLRPSSFVLLASLDAIPLHNAWADVTICGLTLGHLEELEKPLSELRRVTRPGGTLLCSDFHPIGETLGWRREFKAGGLRYAVRHTSHSIDDWHRACRTCGLRIVQIMEPRLDPADIPPAAHFDPTALEVPAALVFELRRER